jgi:hypothetical protein
MLFSFISCRKKFTKILALTSLCVSVACGGTYPAASTSKKEVTIVSSANAGEYKIENFTNADWLFNTYLGEYGLPESFKKQITPELQMAANGFALLKKQGGDVDKAMAQFDAGARKMLATKMLQDALAQPMAEMDSVPTAEEMEAKKKALLATLTPEQIAQFEQAAKDSVLTQETIEKYSIDKDPEIQKYLKEQAEIVEKNGLPYALDGHNRKVLSVDQMLGMKSKSGSDTGSQVNEWGPYDHGQVWSRGWVNADVIAGRGPASNRFFDEALYGYYSHVGVYGTYGNAFNGIIIDAMPSSDRPVGVDFEDWRLFRHGYHIVDAYRTPLDWYSGYYIVQWAGSQIGQPYSLLGVKGSKGPTYCSLLVYNAYLLGAGIRIDTASTHFTMPDDVTLYSNYMTRWASFN